MPTPLSNSIARALRDTRISNNEVTSLISEARNQLTPQLKAEVKAELAQLLAQHADKFSNGGKRDLEKFLGSTTSPSSPALPQEPPAPVTPRDLADPSVLTKHATDTTWKPVDGGALYVDGVSFDDVVQGSIGNCYMVASLSAVAYSNPDLVKNAITQNPDNTYTVRFFENGRPVNVTVDGDMAQSSYGSSRYGKSRTSNELWVGLLEKAFAQWKGGYDAIGNGGLAGDVISALTGKSISYTSTKTGMSELVWQNLKRGGAAKKPMAAVTYGTEDASRYTGTSIYAHHMYTVLGTSEENGTRYVQLRNPWGSTEPGSDGKNDGIFNLKLEDFMKLYQGVSIGN